MEVSTIEHYLSLKDYGKKKGVDWRTAKKLVVNGQLILFLFRGKKVYIELSELQKFLLSKM